MKILSDETGEEIEVLTPEEAKAAQDAAVAAEVTRLQSEHAKALADKDAHVKEKLDQFQRAQGGVEAKENEAKTLAEEAKKIAEEAKASVASAEAEKIATKKDYFIRSVVAGDPELTSKIHENLKLLTMPEGTDAEIAAKVQKAVQMSGIGSIQTNPGFSFAGGMPSAPQKVDQSVKDHNYEVWKNELQINDLVPKNNK